MLRIILCVFFFLFIYQLCRYVNKRKRLPPGPIRWPVIGNVIELALADSKNPHLALAKMADKYGPIVYFGFGVHDAVLVSSFEAMKTIFTKDEIYGRYAFPFVYDRAFHERLGLAWSDGSMWRELRKYSAKTLRDFGFGKHQSIEMVLGDEMDEMISIIKAKTSDNGIFTVDPNILCGSALLGYSNSMMEIMGHSNIYNPFPFLRYLFPKWTKFYWHKKTHKQTQDLMMEIISQARAKRVLRMSKRPENFIDAFLDEIDKNTGNNVNGVFTEKQLMLVLMDLFLGGSERTGTMMNWIFLYLTLHNWVQEKIHDELTDYVQSDGSISISKFDRMPFTRATLYEIFRVAPILPIPPPREALSDYHYKEYLIPKGSIVMCILPPVLTDTNFWGDPEVFRPERFLDPSGKKLMFKYTERVPVFGFGKRTCIGEALAWDTLIMATAKIMQMFTFEAIAGQEPSQKDPICAMTLSPRPYTIKIHLRH